ncbi:protease HtpX [Taylorella equigenitalis]|uniref:Protease HtpX homolog n=3 Tax=Taylorella equigenitalis TaxID=29575 RepID=A0A654KF65_TAYEM|nr:protease HtpX [Taylorella equigenitalis]ADU91050.1 peptidase M48, Ste24p [Taylorella equigenitalis MCE9]AFN36153.1 putative protease, HtpX-like protein [Taylorella equigenitalis ATCC 35865]ASY30783.1 zinc metalloprotease HtpX [Taylorella equigenitalis]ASY38085.1 protease HtpX [Taylorella equigenitalis]ASY39560.1 zinc metalloprotease HtpX [Taylorella equigenitalis]
MKNIFLLTLTNLAVVTLLMLVFMLLSPVLQEYGIYTEETIGLGIMALVVGFVGSFISLLLSKFIAKRTMGVQVIDPKSPRNEAENWILNTTYKLADTANIKRPEVGIFQGAPNAFATGPSKNNSLVAVSTGLLNTMNKAEVEAVIGHEISHIKNGDMVTMTLLQGVLNTFVIFFSQIIARALSRNENGRSGGFLSYYLVYFLLQTILGALATIIVCWYSRKREFKADSGSADLLQNNQSMIDALKVLGGLKESPKLGQGFAAFGICFGGILATHPPIEKRIASLEAWNLNSQNLATPKATRVAQIQNPEIKDFDRSDFFK